MEARGQELRVVIDASAPLQYTAFMLSEPLRLVLDLAEARLGEVLTPRPLGEGPVSHVEVQEFPEQQMVRVGLHLRRPMTHTIDVHGAQLQVLLQESPPSVAAVPTPGVAQTLASHTTLVTEVNYATLPEHTLVNIQTRGEPPRVRVKQHQQPLQILLDIEQAQLHSAQEMVIPLPRSSGVLTQLTAFQLGEAETVRVVAHLHAATPFEVRQDGATVHLVLAHGATPVAALAAPPVARPAGRPSAPSSSALRSAQLTPLPSPTALDSRKMPLVRTQATVSGASPGPSAAGRTTITSAPAIPESQGPRYTGEKISLDFQNADINDILRLIAEVSGLNIIAGGDVQGSVTTRMIDVPWDQALEVILKINGLAQEREGNIIRVAPAERFMKEREASLQARQAENQAEPTITQVVPVNYANVAELRNNLDKLKSDRGTIDIDPRTNTMIITDIKKNLDDILSLVDTLDRQTPQVMIEARIVEASRNFTHDLGIRFGGQYRTITDRTFPNRIAIGGAASDTAPGNFLVDLPAAVGAGSGGAIGFALAGASSILNVELSALERSGQGKTISNPRIATLDNTEAQIQSGVRIPFVTTSAEGTKTELVDASLVLKVTPHVTPDGFINLKINVTNNQPNPQLTSGGQPSISTREANTAMLVRDGDTVVIGGLYRREFSSTRDGVPGLSDVPVLGWLFRRTQEQDRNEELLIFITPHIIRQPEEPGKARAARSYSGVP
jgi:type IV pilus secretin PilQ/predicted competence protein